MCLKSQPLDSIPRETARYGATLVAPNSLYRFVGDTLLAQYQDEDFADLYHAEGKPGLSPVMLAFVIVFQMLEHLSDKGTVNAVRMRIDWKYALHLPLDYTGFDPSVLSEFRTRLLNHQAEQRVFDRLLDQMREQGLLKRRGTQRTDSTHVLAAVRALNRLETVGEAMRAALNVLADVAPAWLLTQASPEWLKRYGPQFCAWHLPQTEMERQALIDQIGRDGHALLQAIYAPDTPDELRELPAVDVLRQVWLQQYYCDAEGIHWRKVDNLPPATQAIHSPHDAAARYSNRKGTSWVGYKVHLTEACDDDAPRLITNVELTPAPIADTDLTDIIHDHLAAKDRLPAAHLVDAGYTDAAHIVKSQHDHAVDLVGPVPIEPSWQAQSENGYAASQFRIDWEAKRAYCPQGKVNKRWTEGVDGNGNPTVQIAWRSGDCRACGVREQCTTSSRAGRCINIRRQAEHEALIAARQRQKTDAFKQQYRMRAGIEGSLSLGVRTAGLRRSRYFGEAKTRLQEIFIAIALNLSRISAWLAGERPAAPRKTTFVKLMKAANAA